MFVDLTIWGTGQGEKKHKALTEPPPQKNQQQWDKELCRHQAGEHGARGCVPGSGAEILMQPLEKTMVKQVVHLQPMEKLMSEQAYSLKEIAAHKEAMQELGYPKGQ